MRFSTSLASSFNSVLSSARSSLLDEAMTERKLFQSRVWIVWRVSREKKNVGYEKRWQKMTTHVFQKTLTTLLCRARVMRCVR